MHTPQKRNVYEALHLWIKIYLGSKSNLDKVGALKYNTELFIHEKHPLKQPQAEKSPNTIHAEKQNSFKKKKESHCIKLNPFPSTLGAPAGKPMTLKMRSSWSWW